jgi:hypothetical protein
MAFQDTSAITLALPQLSLHPLSKPQNVQRSRCSSTYTSTVTYVPCEMLITGETRLGAGAQKSICLACRKALGSSPSTIMLIIVGKSYQRWWGRAWELCFLLSFSVHLNCSNTVFNFFKWKCLQQRPGLSLFILSSSVPVFWLFLYITWFFFLTTPRY